MMTMGLVVIIGNLMGDPQVFSDGLIVYVSGVIHLLSFDA